MDVLEVFYLLMHTKGFVPDAYKMHNKDTDVTALVSAVTVTWGQTLCRDMYVLPPGHNAARPLSETPTWGWPPRR